MKNNNANLPAIPAQRYFTLQQACQLADLDAEQVHEWQQQEGQVLGKGTHVLTRADVIKLRQMRHSIRDYFARGALDIDGNPVIDAAEMRSELEVLLTNIEKALAQ